MQLIEGYHDRRFHSVLYDLLYFSTKFQGLFSLCGDASLRFKLYVVALHLLKF